VYGQWPHSPAPWRRPRSPPDDELRQAAALRPPGQRRIGCGRGGRAGGATSRRAGSMCAGQGRVWPRPLRYWPRSQATRAGRRPIAGAISTLSSESEAAAAAADEAEPPALQIPVAAGAVRTAYVIGTFDTKGREPRLHPRLPRPAGVSAPSPSTSSSSGKPSPATVNPTRWRGNHPRGQAAVFHRRSRLGGDRDGRALERFILTRRDVGGVIIGAGGSGRQPRWSRRRCASLPVGAAQDDGVDHRVGRT